MTLHYMQTARYNATPRLAHIDTPKPTTKPKLTFAEMAALENKAAGLSAKPDYTRKSTAGQDPNSLYARIFQAVRDHGPIYVEDVVQIVNVKPRQVYNVVNKAKEMAGREGYKWCVEDVRFGAKCKRRYWLEAAQ